MLDFQNLTDEQKAFFNDLWESHQRENEHVDDSAKEFETYIAKRRKLEDDQARAAEVLKTKMV